MEFSWGEAVRIALVGFLGVFIILFILQLALRITSAVVRRIEPKKGDTKVEKK